MGAFHLSWYVSYITTFILNVLKILILYFIIIIMLLLLLLLLILAVLFSFSVLLDWFVCYSVLLQLIQELFRKIWRLLKIIRTLHFPRRVTFLKFSLLQIKIMLLQYNIQLTRIREIIRMKLHFHLLLSII